MGAIMLCVLLILFLFLGVPLGIAIGFATLLCFAFFTNIPITIVAQNCFAGLNAFTLLAIPFFLLAGNLMSDGGIARRLMDFANTLIGFISGGLAMAVTMACMFFAAISGSSAATTSAIGAFAAPEMKRQGYPVPFNASLIACGGVIGIIIPPSIPLVIYGVVTNTSIGDLFIAGVLPGIVARLALMAVCYYFAKKEKIRKNGNVPTLKELLLSLKNAFWAILAPLIVLGSIYTGLCTPTEASVIAVFYALIIGAFVYRQLTWKSIYDCMLTSIVMNGALCFLVALSVAFANYLSLEQIPAAITNVLLSLSDNTFVVLLLINIFLLMVGCFLDIIPAILILAPILLPAVAQLGVSPVTFGVVMIINLGIGFVTPPYGPSLFFSAAICGCTMTQTLRYHFKFLIAMIAALLLTTYIPWLTLGLLK